jgi:hypothetical protein
MSISRLPKQISEFGCVYNMKVCDLVSNSVLRQHILLFLYADRSDPIVFLSLVVDTSGRLYDDRQVYPPDFLACSSWGTALTNEQETDQFRFLIAPSLVLFPPFSDWAAHAGCLSLSLRVFFVHKLDLTLFHTSADDFIRTE